MLSYYRDKYQLKPDQFHAAQAANDCSISLPLFHGMLPEEQKTVIKAVKAYRR
jgi:perosamine synthetase